MAPPASFGGVPEIARALHREGFELGAWRIEPRRHRFSSEDEEKTVDPRLIDLLVCLASRPGEVVTKEELLDSVWRGAFVSDNTVAQAVSRLRKALGDDPRSPTYLETIPRSGYRLLVEVWRPAPARRPDRGWAGASGRVEPAGQARSPSSGRKLGPVGLAAILATSLVAAGFAAVATFRPRPGLRIVEVRPESTLVGNQFEPSLSPDGRRLVFAWRDPEATSWHLWLQPIGGDQPVRLTAGPGNERLPAWSPDGQAVAFARFSDEAGACGIFAVPAVGGRAERLGDCLDGMRSLDWSPGGRELVTNAGDGSGGQALFLFDLETGESRRLTGPQPGVVDRSARFSPDGDRVAFLRAVSTSRHDVMVVSAAGGDARALTRDPWGQVRGLDWTRDGGAVLFSSNRGGRFALWRVPASGDGGPSRLPIHDEWVTQPSVARDVGRLTYRTFRDVVDLWQLSLDAEGETAGEPIRRLASTRSERQPVWSPDGTRVAFLSDRTGSLELWSGTADGDRLLRHTDLRGPLPGSPAWSPDGGRLAFDAAVHGQSDLWTVAVDSRRPVRLTSDPSEERNPTYSRDGLWLYFASDRTEQWEIWRMPAGGGTAERMTHGGGFLAQETRRGDVLYYVDLDGPTLRRMPTAGGPPELVFDGLDLSDWGNWVVAERGLWLVTRNPTTIAFLGFDEEEPRVVYAPAEQVPFLERSISLSNDGRALLFAMIDHSDDEIMRVEVDGI